MTTWLMGTDSVGFLLSGAAPAQSHRHNALCPTPRWEPQQYCGRYSEIRGPQLYGICSYTQKTLGVRSHRFKSLTQHPFHVGSGENQLMFFLRLNDLNCKRRDTEGLVHGVAIRVMMKSCMPECFVSHTAPSYVIKV